MKFTINPLPIVHADVGLLRQVWYNLLSNAVKFTRREKTARIEIGSFQSDGERVIYVKDNGAGFDMNYSHKLFTVFQRLHSNTEFDGTGVGLSVVRSIVQRHGGRVWAEGEEGKGATFFFTIPDSESMN